MTTICMNEKFWLVFSTGKREAETITKKLTGEFTYTQTRPANFPSTVDISVLVEARQIPTLLNLIDN